MPPLPRRRLLTLHLMNRRDDPPPDSRAVQVALVEHGIGLHGSLNRRSFAVLLDQGVGGAVDVASFRPFQRLIYIPSAAKLSQGIC